MSFVVTGAVVGATDEVGIMEDEARRDHKVPFLIDIMQDV